MIDRRDRIYQTVVMIQCDSHFHPMGICFRKSGDTGRVLDHYGNGVYLVKWKDGYTCKIKISRDKVEFKGQKSIVEILNKKI